MKKFVLAVGCLLMASGAAWAVDYSKLSTDELSRMRGTMYNASQTEWNAFHTEWWKRLDKMTPEQRQQYFGPGRGGMAMGRGMGRGPGWWGAGAANQGTGN